MSSRVDIKISLSSAVAYLGVWGTLLVLHLTGVFPVWDPFGMNDSPYYRGINVGSILGFTVLAATVVVAGLIAKYRARKNSQD